jgi:hypothetical protein
MRRALAVFILFAVGALLLTITLLGAMGVLEKFLFISLEPLRTSWEWSTGLAIGGGFCWFCAGLIIRTK